MMKGGMNECGLSKLAAFRGGGCVCFSDSSQPKLTDAGKVTEKKCVNCSDEKETEEGVCVWGGKFTAVPGEFLGYFCSVPSS